MGSRKSVTDTLSNTLIVSGERFHMDTCKSVTDTLSNTLIVSGERFHMGSRKSVTDTNRFHVTQPKKKYCQ